MTAPALTHTPLEALQALQEKKDWATTLAKSSLLPPAYQQAPANVLLAAEYADTLGVPRMTALTGIHVIKGKPSISADLMASLVRRAGHRLRVAGDARSATATLIRADDPDYTYEATWTIDRAKQANLVDKPGSSWRTYPEALLRSRAITEVCRMGASEVLFGAIYAPEELGAQVDESGTPIAVESWVEPIPAPVADTSDKTPEQAVASPDLMDEIHGYAKQLRLSKTQIAATAKYCGHTGDPGTVPTLDVAYAMSEYLQSRLEQALAEQAAAAQVEEAQEVLDGEIIEEDPARDMSSPMESGDPQ